MIMGVRGENRRGSCKVKRRALAGSSLAWGIGVALATSAQAQSLPVGGTPVDPAAVSIATGANQVTVTQTSDRGVINWTSFDVAQGNSVVFNQPSATAATLNRVSGATSSTIAGSITANGSVYLVNPNGIAITSTGNVQTGGGFIASTLDITDANFNAGTNTFAGTGASANVGNAGSIAANGFAALLGGTVSNSAIISVPAGRIALGSGEAITLDINGANFLQVAMPTTATTSGSTALIEQSGTITGGRIELSAATATNAVRNVVNMTGTLNANSATGAGGTILLSTVAGTGIVGGGTIAASGSMTAQATGATGAGGTITLRGGTLVTTGLTASTTAASGTTGTLALGQATAYTPDAGLGGLLATNNVAIGTSTSGGVTIANPVSWTTSNTLTIVSVTDIALNAAITGTAGTLALIAGRGVAYTGAITDTAPLSVGIFNLLNGNWSQSAATLPSFKATDFRFTAASANFLRATGGDGSSGTPYQITDVYGLQGMASGNTLGNNFVLATAIDASGTAAWNSSAGFVSIGTANTPFTGTFAGGNFVIAGLTINRPSTDYIGLFGSSSGTIRNIGLSGANIRGGNYVGTLIGLNNGTVTNSFAGGAVGGNQRVGGLVGQVNASATLTYSYANVAVTGTDYVGGLTSYIAGQVKNSYATGAVLGGNYAGGLAGFVFGGTVNNAYATGSVNGIDAVGGLIGWVTGSAAISSVYASGRVFGRFDLGGLIGYQLNGAISNGYFDSYSTGMTAAVGTLDGGTRTNLLNVTSDPAQSAVANYAYKSTAYANLTAASGLGTATPTGFAVLAGNSTRPFLAFEVPVTGNPGVTTTAGVVTLTNAHQLQLVDYNAATLAGSYRLGGNIDLAETGRVVVGTPGSYSGLWAGTGFVALGTDGAGNIWNGTAFATNGTSGFTGTLDGAGYGVSGLTINRSTSYQGLFGYATGSGGTIANVVLTGGSVRGMDYTGSLVGYNVKPISNSSSSATVAGSSFTGGLIGSTSSSGTVTNSSATGAVSGAGLVGGLIGYISSGAPALSGVYATGSVTGTGIGVGGLIGSLSTSSTVTNAYATGAVTSSYTASGSAYVGGLIGQMTGTGGTLNYVYATGPVSALSTNPASYVGGLVGSFGGTIKSAYATGAVSSQGGYVGGLVGNANSGTIYGVYATGSVSGTTNIGGLVGYNRATVSNAYASGFVTGSASRGGLFGNNTSTATNSYWDSYSTGQSVSSGGGGTGGTVAVTSDPAMSAAGNYAFSAASYANLAPVANLGTATVSGFVFLPGNSTRPFLAFEVPVLGNPGVSTNAAGQIVLNNTHQLQLIGANAGALAGSYTLGGNISLAETGANTGTATTSGGMWSQAGFVSLGTNGAGLTWDGTTYKSIGTITSGIYGFGGTFDGGGFTLSNLFINRPNINNIGLFGTVSGTLKNVTVGGKVTGGNGTGGLAGMLIGGPTASTTGLSPVVSNAISTVNVTGLQVVGGLIGSATQRSSVLGSSASGTVSGTNTVGGLIGSANRAIVTGFASGAVTGQGYIGGLIGQQFAGTTTGYATGAVSGTIAVGGLIGVLDGTATERGTATATRAPQSAITGPTSSDRNFGRVTANGTATTIAPS